MMGVPNTADAPVTDTKVWTVREANDREDALSLARLWHHYFGTEYEANWLPHPLARIAGWVDADEGRELAVLGLLAEHEDVRIGGALATILDHDDCVEELPDGRYDKDALAGDRNAWLLLGAVDPAWRGHGIGWRLFNRRIEWANEWGADMLFSFGWERREGRGSRPLFEANDFVPVQRFPDRYAETRGSCPDCGSWPNNDRECQCELTLWALDLQQGGAATDV